MMIGRIRKSDLKLCILITFFIVVLVGCGSDGGDDNDDANPPVGNNFDYSGDWTIDEVLKGCDQENSVRNFVSISQTDTNATLTFKDMGAYSGQDLLCAIGDGELRCSGEVTYTEGGISQTITFEHYNLLPVAGENDRADGYADWTMSDASGGPCSGSSELTATRGGDAEPDNPTPEDDVVDCQAENAACIVACGNDPTCIVSTCDPEYRACLEDRSIECETENAACVLECGNDPACIASICDPQFDDCLADIPAPEDGQDNPNPEDGQDNPNPEDGQDNPIPDGGIAECQEEYAACILDCGEDASCIVLTCDPEYRACLAGNSAE